MKPRHQISRAAIVLIERFEGFRASAAQLPDGRWTIGYGHTKTARAGAQVSVEDAEALLLYDLIAVAHAVNEWSFAPLNQNQFDALVSFAFNIGLENFRGSTTLRRLNEGRALEAALAMELWRRADFEGERIVVDALVRRRAYEKTLFLKPVDAWAPAPTPVLPPKLDYDAASVLPSQIPTVVRASLEGERALAKREAPIPFVPLADDEPPTASESAAAAVSARLGGILAEPAEPGAAQAAAAEGAADPPALEAGDKSDAWQPWLAPSGEWRGLGLGLLAVIGAALFAAALHWGFKPPEPGAPAWRPLLVGWGLGGLGIACFAVAAYYFLARFGDGEGAEPRL
jgi:lysozyme